MNNIIFGSMDGYIANRAIVNEEYRLDLPELKPETISSQFTPKSRTTLGLLGLGRGVRVLSQQLFNGNSKKPVEEGKARP